MTLDIHLHILSDCRMAVRAVLVDRFQIRPEELALASRFERDFSAYKASLRRWVLQAEDPRLRVLEWAGCGKAVNPNGRAARRWPEPFCETNPPSRRVIPDSGGSPNANGDYRIVARRKYELRNGA